MDNRELDRKVAEALGIIPNSICQCTLDDRPALMTWAGDIGYVHGSCRKPMAIPYSTDIAAAIGALEEFCKARGLEWDIAYTLKDGYGCWLAKPEVGWLDASRVKCLSNTIPLAICNAILSASSPKQSVGDAALRTSAGDGE